MHYFSGGFSCAHLVISTTCGLEGFQDCGPTELAAEMQLWVDDNCLRRWFGHPDPYARLAKYTPHLLDLWSHLAGGHVPQTFVHGDPGRRNAALAAESRPIPFDWEFACVSHPFYDWHELHGEASDKVRQAYLKLFAEYGTEHELHVLYDAGRTLCWCVKMWRVLRIRRWCDVGLNSFNGATFLQFWEHAWASLIHMAFPGVPEDVGPK